MSDDFNQIEIPRSFIDLFIDPGRIKPREPRAFIAERYEYCEDLAQMLVDTAQDRLDELRVTQSDVLERIGRGLGELPAGLTVAEVGWVRSRLVELLGWEDAAAPGDGPDEARP